MTLRPMSASIALRADLPRFADERAAAIRRGATRGADRFRARAKLDFRRDTRAALGDRAANTWRDTRYPERGESWHPAVSIWSKWPVVINAFTEGATIKAKKGVALAIPTENVPNKGRRPMTPLEVESRFDQDLILKPSRGGNMLAFVDRGLKGRLKRWRAKGGGAQTAPTARAGRLTLMFVMVRQVTLRPRLSWPALGARLGPVFRDYIATGITQETAR